MFWLADPEEPDMFEIDDGAVVDTSGRVHGADGTTIADASIMPDVPSGFTHLSTIMIAERLAEAVP